MDRSQSLLEAVAQDIAGALKPLADHHFARPEPDRDVGARLLVGVEKVERFGHVGAEFLAAEAGICMECHTPRTPQGALDATKLFAGGEGFEIGGPFGTVVSRNITPHASGIAGWTAEEIRTELLTGIDQSGSPICPPMPDGPEGAFGGLTPEHALAIGRYITTLPPIANPEDGGVFPQCNFPPPPPDGGLDASTPDGSADGSADGSVSDAADSG